MGSEGHSWQVSVDLLWAKPTGSFHSITVLTVSCFLQDVPEDVANNKRYAGLGGFTISEVADKVAGDYGKIDFLVHSLANGPEVTKPLLETSRRGYLAASSASAYSMVSLVQKFAPIMNPGGSVLSLTYAASEKVCGRMGHA